MEWLKDNHKISQWISKYKFAAVVLLIGLLLMLLPSKTNTEPIVKENSASEEIDYIPVSKELEQILSMIDGAGEVKVMLSVSTGEETIYQSDPQQTDGQTGSVGKSTTVIISDSDRSELGLVRQVNPQTYQGAIVVCQGGSDPAVCFAIVQAVSDITGLRSDQISVLKMK